MSDQPVGITEISEQIGEDRNLVAQWVFRGKLPDHDGTIGGRKWWWQSTIDRWVEEKERT